MEEGEEGETSTNTQRIKRPRLTVSNCYNRLRQSALYFLLHNGWIVHRGLALSYANCYLTFLFG